MKVKKFFSVTVAFVVLILGVTGCTKQITEKPQFPTENQTEESVGSETSTGNQTMSEDGVNFSELTLIPDRGIITFKIENTTRAAKQGYVRIACLDKDGLQLKDASVGFNINALTTDVIQGNEIPSETVSVKFLRTLVINK